MVTSDATEAERAELSRHFNEAAERLPSPHKPRLRFFDFDTALEELKKNHSVSARAAAAHLRELYRHPGVAALAEWSVAARADVFIGSAGSRVSLHIAWDRARLGFPADVSNAVFCAPGNAAVSLARASPSPESAFAFWLFGAEGGCATRRSLVPATNQTDSAYVQRARRKRERIQRLFETQNQEEEPRDEL